MLALVFLSKSPIVVVANVVAALAAAVAALAAAVAALATAGISVVIDCAARQWSFL